MISKKLNNIQEKLFDIFVIISYLLVFVSTFINSTTAKLYLSTLDYYARIYICLFLIWRFNPLRTQYEFTNLDRKIAFSAGIFILTTTILIKYLDYFKTFTTTIIESS
jgi:hypothetical protein